MTHDEEFGQFVGEPDKDKAELCRRCNDYPCRCSQEERGCETCGGTGVERSGVCHCGIPMDSHSVYEHAGYPALEMERCCPDCNAREPKDDFVIEPTIPSPEQMAAYQRLK